MLTWVRRTEPRAIMVLMPLLWAVTFTVGVLAILVPPPEIADGIGPVINPIWDWFLVGGGLLGLIGCPIKWWWVERAGIIFTSTGLAMYFYLILVLSHENNQPGLHMVQLGVTLLAMGLFATRWIRISGAQIDPAKGRPIYAADRR